MEFLYVVLLIITSYWIYKFFSYLKNQEVSRPKINPMEFFNQKRLELQQIIDAKKEDQRREIKVTQKLEDPINIITPIDDIENQPWRQFEREVARLFENRWFKADLWPWKNDNWIDIVITRGLEIYAIQCKHYYWRKMVSANEVRDFQWAIDLYEKQNNLTVRGWIFVTSWKSSAKSRETARTLWIALWDKYNWKEKINIL